MSRSVTITLESEDWIEIVCALETKARLVRNAYFGPEEVPGHDTRWFEHLTEVKKKIENVLY